MTWEKAKIINLCDKVILFSLYVMIFFLPISKAIIEISSTLAIVCYIIKKITQGKGTPKTYLSLGVFAYAIVCFFSIFISTNFKISARIFLGKTVQEILIFFVLSDTLNSERRVKNFIYILFASALLLGTDGIYQYFTHKDFIRHRPFYFEIPRIHATFSSANDYGAYLATIIPFTLVCLFSKPAFKKSIRFLTTGLFILLFICLILTVSRGAWFASLSAMLFMSIWIRVLGIFFLVLGIFVMLTQQFYYSVLKERLVNLFIFTDESSLDRMRIWEAAWRMFMYNPWLGLGLGTFMFNFNNFVVERYRQGLIPYAHNCYLQIAAEVGIFGLVAFLSILVFFFSYGIETIIYRPKTFSWYILLASLASVLGYCVQMTVDTTLYSLDLGMLFWILLGLGVATMNNVKLEAKAVQEQ
jgi:putative inorganic carbon (HCO3(-)) transporter